MEILCFSVNLPMRITEAEWINKKHKIYHKIFFAPPLKHKGGAKFSKIIYIALIISHLILFQFNKVYQNKNLTHIFNTIYIADKTIYLYFCNRFNRFEQALGA